MPQRIEGKKPMKLQWKVFETTSRMSLTHQQWHTQLNIWVCYFMKVNLKVDFNDFCFLLDNMGYKQRHLVFYCLYFTIFLIFNVFSKIQLLSLAEHPMHTDTFWPCSDNCLLSIIFTTSLLAFWKLDYERNFFGWFQL